MEEPIRPGADDGASDGAGGAASEARQIERVRCGDAEAYGELVRRHMRRAFSIAYRILEHREDAEDVVQEAFLTAFERFDTFERGRRFGPWLYRIVVNRALNFRRARSVRRTEPIPADAPADSALPDGAAERAELARRLRAAAAALPERQRTIVQLSELEGFTSAEIAEILGVSDGTVRWHLHRARQALRRALAPLREEGS
ncbi:MAG TPA: sigma-70 family RNA polymerase sigma factor [Longimicrobiales bacterium]